MKLYMCKCHRVINTQCILPSVHTDLHSYPNIYVYSIMYIYIHIICIHTHILSIVFFLYLFISICRGRPCYTLKVSSRVSGDLNLQGSMRNKWHEFSSLLRGRQIAVPVKLKNPWRPVGESQGMGVQCGLNNSGWFNHHGTMIFHDHCAGLNHDSVLLLNRQIMMNLWFWQVKSTCCFASISPILDEFSIWCFAGQSPEVPISETPRPPLFIG